MSIRSSAGKFHGRSDSVQIYRRSFVERVHQLIAAGYSQLDRVTLNNQEEPAITGFLVREIRCYIESPTAPSWATHFTVHDDPPIESPGAAGKSRPRVDIEMERVQAGPRPRFQFEAKRLHTGASVSEYVGENGLQSFLSGRYAATHRDAGMLGYVQTRSVQDWLVRIQRKMDTTRSKLFLDAQGVVWQSRTDPLLAHSYSSLHQRPGMPIRIHHTFLECC